MHLPRRIEIAREWVGVNWRDVARVCTIIGVGLLAAFFISVSTANGKQAAVNAKILSNQQIGLNHLQGSNERRDKLLKQIEANNAQQTLILCTLILSDHTISTPDLNKIEKICNERISAVTATNQTSSASTSSPSQSHNKASSSSSAKPKPKSKPPQSNNSQPTPVKRVTNFVSNLVSGTLNLL